jgi:hypothetical protein
LNLNCLSEQENHTIQFLAVVVGNTEKPRHVRDIPFCSIPSYANQSC